MRALLYDIHGNLPALEAVLDDAAAEGADTWLLGGDYAAFGGWPAEVVGRLRALDGAVWIRGNADRWLRDDADVPADSPVPAALEACREALGAALVDALVGLPEQARSGEQLFCHASPRNDMESFAAAADDGVDRHLLGATEADRVIFGHTNIAFLRGGPDGVELLNPGSVGIPLDGDVRASYALMHDDGSIEHRRVDYDHEAAAEGVVTRFGGASWTATFARRIRTARFD